MRDPKPCKCGSGELDYELCDAAGIFCTYVCSECEDRERRKYNPHIFRSGTSYSATGEEWALDIDDEGDQI
jgi:hypothetical protein